MLPPILLAGVLALSGVAKLRARRSTVSVLMLLRLPRPLTRGWMALALPVGELALALALVLAPPGWTAVVTASVTLLLFAIYWLVVARALRFDPRPNCGCFGRIGDQRISARTLVRNTLFVLLAALGLAWSVAGGAVLAALADATTADWAWLAGAAVTGLVASLIGRPSRSPAPVQPAHTVQPVRPEEPSEGDYLRRPFPPVLLADGDARRSLTDLTHRRPLLLVWHSRRLEGLTRWRDLLPEVDVRRMAPTAADDDVLVDADGTAAVALGCTGQPCAVLLGADGLTAGGPSVGEPEIESLVHDIRHELDAAGLT